MKDKTFYSLPEYFELEDGRGERYEYYDGEVWMMAGGTLNHSRIVATLNTLIDGGLVERGRNCELFESNMRIRIEKGNAYVYPDLSVVCGGLEVDDMGGMAIANPILVIEVLSKSTAAYDKTAKLDYYLGVESIREIVFVDQYKARVSGYYRDDNGFWLFRWAESLEGRYHLKSIDLWIHLRDVYRRVVFS